MSEQLLYNGRNPISSFRDEILEETFHGKHVDFVGRNL